MRTILVTGGAGFIGSNLVHHFLNDSDARVVTIDALTYAGHLESLDDILNHPKHVFVHGDITDRETVSRLFSEYAPSWVIHLAAESHVDRSITAPSAFIITNVVGTQVLLDNALVHYEKLAGKDRENFRFLHVSTDEVFGSLDESGYFTETSRYRPNSPYAASKAAADHIVRSYFATYGLPCLITNCGNNFGPYQYPEKLLPLAVTRALRAEHIPVYGDGRNIRDWIYVTDHCRALHTALEQGHAGETYNVGAGCEMSNIDIIKTLCVHLDELNPLPENRPHEDLIAFVPDRPGTTAVMPWIRGNYAVKRVGNPGWISTWRFVKP